MGGNLIPVAKSGEQLYISFHSFHENRLPVVVRIRDSNEDAIGRLAFMQEPKVARGEVPLTPICTLNIKLPDLDREATIEKEQSKLKPSYNTGIKIIACCFIL